MMHKSYQSTIRAPPNFGPRPNLSIADFASNKQIATLPAGDMGFEGSYELQMT